MNFSIEAPAETNPLTKETLYHALLSASSNNQQQMQTGTKQLQHWQKTPGFNSSLQSLYIDTSLPLELRYLSIIQLKNAVDKYWRKTAKNAMSKEEKELIKSRSVESILNEADIRLALQASIIIAKIVRAEFPREWPDAISSVVEKLQSTVDKGASTLHSSRLLLILLYVVKELLTVRLRLSQESLVNAAPSITQVLSLVYLRSADKWMTFLRYGGEDEGGALECMDQSLLALRVLRRLIIQYKNPHRDQAIQELWTTFTAQFGQMLNMISDHDQPLELQAGPKSLIQKHLLQIAKFHLNMSKTHPTAFGLLPGSPVLVRSYWGLACQFSETYGKQPSSSAKIGTDGDNDEDDEVTIHEKLSLIGLLLLRACGAMVYRPWKTYKYTPEDDEEERKKSKDTMSRELLTIEFASQIMQTLVTRFFIFTARDLKQWEEEPDDWEKNQEGAGDDWEFSIRTCAEKLFLDVIIHNKTVLVPQLLDLISAATNAHDSDNVFLKDSIYAAIGLAAPVLESNFNFANFLESTLVQVVQTQRPNYNILRRRVAIVLGQWVPVTDGFNRPLVYQIFQHLLDKSDPLNDEVVRVTAGRQLNNVIIPFEFTSSGFAPFASTTIQSLMALIQEVELAETKLMLLDTLNLIMNKMQTEIIPFGDQIISLLPPLWEQADEQYLLKNSILRSLSILVTSTQAESRKYRPIMIPLIESSIDPASTTRTYLLEDALFLWSTMLQETPAPATAPAPPEIVAMVHHLIPMFELASDTLLKALSITELYIYLIPSEILMNASIFLTPLQSLLIGDPDPDVLLVVTHLAEILIRSAGQVGGVQAVEGLTQVMLSTNFLQTLVNGLWEAHQAHQTSGPNKRYPLIDDEVEGQYLNVLARLAVTSPSLFVSAISAANSNPPSIDWLIDEWLNHMDSIPHPVQTKLNTLALTSLLETNQPWILSRLQQLMSLWTEVITDLVSEDPPRRDTLVYNPTDFSQKCADRTLHLDLVDPVHTIDICDHVRQKLGNAVAACGGLDAFRERWIGDVDKDVLAAFGNLGVL